MAMRGEVEVTGMFESSMFQYEGALCIKCTVTRTEQGKNQTTWTFRVPEHDAEIIREHYADPSMTVELPAFIRAVKEVSMFQSSADKNCGWWSSPLYAQPTLKPFDGRKR